MTARILDFNDGFTSASAPSGLDGFTIVDTQTISSGGQITLDSSPFQLLKVQSDGGDIILSSTPFSGAPLDGTVVRVMNVSDTDRVEFTNNDAASGVIINGSSPLNRFDTIDFIYDSTEDRYIEQGRNF